MSAVQRPTGPPEWQNSIRSQLMTRQVESEAYKDVVEQYRRLARTARELKVRNKALLRGGAVATGAEGYAASQNKQLSMADALRDRDEEVRGLREEVRDLREAKEAGNRREKEWDERWKLRTKDLEILNDEIISLNIEISGMTQRNVALQADNASLLQRWLDKMNSTAEEMNAAFEEEQSFKPNEKGTSVVVDSEEKQGFQEGGKK
ncbi:hypothetical protein M231_02011 [Tremella mesenterica]|uniref:Autophagy-related protein 16 domain-containing protein n=1 Tax=Tremella mesenterica TaxID=5217 RepID=A0A4Q1BS05_TREME|nr:hypothetical protein M231_02011 [Tremella mesenterica]